MTQSNRKRKNRTLLYILLIAIVVVILLLLRSCGRGEKGAVNAPLVTKAPETQAVKPPPPPEPETAAPAPEVTAKPEPAPAPKKPAPEKVTPQKPVPEPPPVKKEAVVQPAPVQEAVPAEAPVEARETIPPPPQVKRQPPPPNPDVEDDKLWAVTRKTNTEDAYKNYLDKFPDGKHAKDAKEVLRSGMYPTGKNAQGYEEFRNIKTGTLFILIPAGEFWMGSPPGEGEPDEHPRHRVYTDAYYIGKYEVTIAQYEKFCEKTGHSVPEKPWLTEEGDNPVVYPTWEDAKAYCDWAGLRLPTEAEWEKAARGGTDTTFYWGDKPAHDMANFLGTGGRDKYTITSPVGSFPPNGFGACDMAGNIWEWCNDWYASDTYERDAEDGVVKNPKGPRRGKYRVIRGGSWNYEETKLRPAFRTRLEPKHWYDYNGFRAAESYMPE
jgi:formylglycine-generating enzyme required for sulfatase activity